MQFVGSRGRQFRHCGKVSDRNRRSVRGDHSADTKAQLNAQERSTQPHQSLKNEIGGETIESESALDVASAGSQGNIKGYSNSEQNNQRRTGQIKVARNGFLEYQ